MPRNPKFKSSFQQKGTYRIVSEFIYSEENNYEPVQKELIYPKNVSIIGYKFLSKLHLFLKVKGQIFLYQVIRKCDEMIAEFSISPRGNKILIATQKNKIFLYMHRIKKKKSRKNSNQISKFFNVLSFSNKINKNGKVISTTFNVFEDFFILSFQNGTLKIINLKYRTQRCLKLTHPMHSLNIKTKNCLSGVILRKFGSNIFILVNLFTEKANYFKNAKNVLFHKKYIVLEKKIGLEILCLCHIIKVKNIKLISTAKKFCFLSDIALLYLEKPYFSVIHISTGKKRECLLYNFFDNFDFANLKFFTNPTDRNNFLLKTLYSNQKFQIFKPLTEKYKILVDSSFYFNKLEKIYDIKFLGRKNFFALIYNSNSILIKTRKNFFYKIQLNQGNSPLLSIETSGGIIIGLNSSGQLFIWNITSFDICLCFFVFPNLSGIFSFLKIKKAMGILSVGGKNGKIKTWEILPKNCSNLRVRMINSIYCRKSPICSLAISINGNILGVATLKKEISMFRLLENSPYIVLRNFNRCFWCLSFSPKDKLLIGGSGNGSIYFFDISNGRCLFELGGHSSPVLCCKFSSDGFHVFSSTSDGKIKIWKIDTGLCVNTITNHHNTVWNFDLSPDSTYLISGCLDGKIVVMKDFGHKLSNLKHRSLKMFVDLQKNVTRFHYGYYFLNLLKKIIAFSDIELLFDFFLFFFDNFKNLSFENFEKVFKVLTDGNLRFLFHSLAIWSSKTSLSSMSQYVLSFLLAGNPIFNLTKVNAISVNSLITSCYKKLEKIKILKKKTI